MYVAKDRFLPITLPLPPLGRRKGRIFRRIEIVHPRRPASRINHDISPPLPRPIPPLARESSGAVRRTRIAPHDIRLVLVRQDIHLRNHDVGNEVVHGKPARIRLREVGVRIPRDDAGVRRAARPLRAVLREAVGGERGIEPLGQGEVGASFQSGLVCFRSVEEFSDQVLPRTVVQAGAVCRVPCVEEREPVVVLCR